MDNSATLQINVAGNAFTNVEKLHSDFTQLVSVVGGVDRSINTTFNNLSERIKTINFSAIIDQVQHVSSAIASISGRVLLYISILHQITTMELLVRKPVTLLYISILHQITTYCVVLLLGGELLYISILHQITTDLEPMRLASCCYISLFYIKSQLHGMALFLK